MKKSTSCKIVARMNLWSTKEAWATCWMAFQIKPVCSPLLPAPKAPAFFEQDPIPKSEHDDAMALFE